MSVSVRPTGNNIARHLLVAGSLLAAALVPQTVMAEQSEFEKWKAAQQQEFEDYQTREDKAFVSFLRREWEEFQIFQGKIRDVTPKPAEAPHTRNSLQSLPEKSFQTSSSTDEESSDLGGFFGHEVEAFRFPLDRDLLLDQPSNRALADAWNTLSSIDHSAVISRLQSYREDLELGDWAMLHLTDYLLAHQYPEHNQRMAYLWFLLNRLGYDLRIGYTRTSLVLLVPAVNTVYGRTYSVIGGRNYYMMPQPQGERIFAYDGSLSPEQSAFDFTFRRLIKTSGYISEVDYAIERGGDEQHLQLNYDAGLTRFLASYPQIDLDWYFAAPPGLNTAQSLASQLQPQLDGLDERAALNRLLHLTQRLFRYMTDDQQFGREKYMLVEESLHYGVNDCEDRSVFLAWLLRNLLDADVIALDYPGHVALAVRTAVRPGDHLVVYQGQKYVVADPTYIGADVGMVMPAMASLTPEVIEIGY